MIRLLTIILVIFNLSSCARFGQAPAPALPAISWEQRQSMLTHLQHFGLNGKIAVITRKDSGSAALAWFEQQGGYSIALSGPFGSSTVKLTGQPGRVTLQASDGKTYRARSPEQLLAERWGYQLPVSNMTYWVRGIPAPGTEAKTQLDGASRLRTLFQQGFHITYEDYTPYGNIDLPTRITMTSNTMRVKLVIYQWRLA